MATTHGIDRATLRQKLIDATRQRPDDAVANGSMTQETADQAASQFDMNVDALLDGNGAPGGSPASP